MFFIHSLSLFLSLSLVLPGEAVPVEEQSAPKEQKNAESTPLVETPAPAPAPPLADAEKTQYEELINDLYQQLDDKVGLHHIWTAEIV